VSFASAASAKKEALATAVANLAEQRPKAQGEKVTEQLSEVSV